MKTQRIECVTPEAVRTHLKTLVESRNKQRKSGRKNGGISVLAAEIGTIDAHMSAVLRGVQVPSGKILEYLGLKKATLYVKADK